MAKTVHRTPDRLHQNYFLNIFRNKSITLGSVVRELVDGSGMNAILIGVLYRTRVHCLEDLCVFLESIVNFPMVFRFFLNEAFRRRYTTF